MIYDLLTNNLPDGVNRDWYINYTHQTIWCYEEFTSPEVIKYIKTINSILDSVLSRESYVVTQCLTFYPTSDPHIGPQTCIKAPRCIKIINDDTETKNGLLALNLKCKLRKLD